MANDKNPVNEEMVRIGHVYKEVDGALEVIPFFFDFGTSTIMFAPVASGKEDRLSSSDFLKRFKYLGAVSSRAEKQTGKDAVVSGAADTAPVRKAAPEA